MLLVSLVASLGAGAYHWFYGDRTFRGYSSDGRLLKQFEMSDEMFLVECSILAAGVMAGVVVAWLVLSRLYRLARDR